jgi:SAM-dependent methyltransferase
MIEDEGAQQVVAFYDAILESRGIRLAPDSMILDYGCGSGRHTYEYLDAGYCNAFGYDLQNYVALRAPKDRERFRFDPIPGNAGGYPRMSEVGRSQCCCAGFSASSNTSRTPTSVTARAGQDTSRFR